MEVVLDDRLERPGVKFKDADLIGFPLRITVAPRQLQEGKVEVTIRSTKEQIPVSLSEVEDWVSLNSSEVRRMPCEGCGNCSSV